MPLSVGGAQLPLSAFFSKSGQSSKRSGKTDPHKASPKRKSSPGRDRDAEPPKKRRKQKENLTPQTSLKAVGGTPDEPSSSSGPRRSPRRRQSTALKASIQDRYDRGEEEPVTILDENDTAEVAKQVVVDLTSIQLDDQQRVEATETRLETSLITQERLHGVLAGGSLPSPPLTAPDARRLKQSRRDEERHVEEMLGETRDIQDEQTYEQVGKGLGCYALTRSHPRESSLVLMPPPELPKAASTSTLYRPLPVPVQKPSSTSSDKWVPSSQTQELSIPAHHGLRLDPSSDSEPRAPFVGETQLVPSSQLDEIELQIPPVSFDTPGTPRASRPLLQATSPLVENNESGGMPSPEVIESSQQMEAEMDATWAETVAARIAAIGWSKETAVEARARTPSPSPRQTESQDYDAHDEFSSQEGNSQWSSDAIRTSPLRVPSQMTESSASYDSQSTVSTPPQLRRFRSMFEGRDERGNRLRSPRPPSPTAEGRNGDVHERLDDISVSPPRIPDHRSSDDSYSYSSSLSETQPTPVRNFMAMFDSQRDVGPSQVPDVW